MSTTDTGNPYDRIIDLILDILGIPKSRADLFRELFLHSQQKGSVSD